MSLGKCTPTCIYFNTTKRMVRYVRVISFLFFFNYPLHHLSRCQSPKVFLAHIYVNRHNWRASPICGQQSARASSEDNTGDNMDKGHTNAHTVETRENSDGRAGIEIITQYLFLVINRHMIQCQLHVYSTLLIHDSHMMTYLAVEKLINIRRQGASINYVNGSVGGRKSVKLCDKGGGILNFVTSHFKNSIKAILHYQPN